LRRKFLAALVVRFLRKNRRQIVGKPAHAQAARAIGIFQRQQAQGVGQNQSRPSAAVERTAQQRSHREICVRRNSFVTSQLQGDTHGGRSVAAQRPLKDRIGGGVAIERLGKLKSGFRPKCVGRESPPPRHHLGVFQRIRDAPPRSVTCAPSGSGSTVPHNKGVAGARARTREATPRFSNFSHALSRARCGSSVLYSRMPADLMLS